MKLAASDPTPAAIVAARPDWGRWPTAFDAADVVERAWTDFAATLDPAARTELRRAFAFMRARHRGQTRRGSRTPFWVHPARVALRVAEWGHPPDGRLLRAALLHDTVEDTLTTLAEVDAGFGADVAALVGWLTVPVEPAGVAAYYRRLALEAPADARLLKVADRVDNLRSIEALAIREPGSHRRWAGAYLRRTAEQVSPLLGSVDPAAADALGHAIADLDRLVVADRAPAGPGGRSRSVIAP